MLTFKEKNFYSVLPTMYSAATLNIFCVTFLWKFSFFLSFISFSFFTFCVFSFFWTIKQDHLIQNEQLMPNNIFCFRLVNWSNVSVVLLKGYHLMTKLLFRLHYKSTWLHMGIHNFNMDWNKRIKVWAKLN